MSLFNRNRFSTISDYVFSLVLLFDGNFYICKTRGKKLNANCISFQTVCNLLEVCELSKEFGFIKKPERVPIARRLLFKRISIMSKGKSPKFKSALCNIPIYLLDVCNTLPRPADSNGIVIVKLK